MRGRVWEPTGGAVPAQEAERSANSLRCPFCGERRNAVTDSRMTRSGEEIRRRRECLGCHRRFSTFEAAVEEERRVKKADGRVEPFDRHKLARSLQSALAAKARPDELAARLEERLFPAWSVGAVPTAAIRLVACEALAEFPAAYVRYRSFEVGDLVGLSRVLAGARKSLATAARLTSRVGVG
jgi:transcriptional repressor NrdR